LRKKLGVKNFLFFLFGLFNFCLLLPNQINAGYVEKLFNILTILKKVVFTAFNSGLLNPATFSYAAVVNTDWEKISTQDQAWRWRSI